MLRFADSSKARIGDLVFAIGNPFGVGQTVTMGIISAPQRAVGNIEKFQDFIQTDASINPGNSGGALVNSNGDVVGINTAILANGSEGNQGIGFAIPAALVVNVLADKLVEPAVSVVIDASGVVLPTIPANFVVPEVLTVSPNPPSILLLNVTLPPAASVAAVPSVTGSL